MCSLVPWLQCCAVHWFKDIPSVTAHLTIDFCIVIPVRRKHDYSVLQRLMSWIRDLKVSCENIQQNQIQVEFSNYGWKSRSVSQAWIALQWLMLINNWFSRTIHVVFWWPIVVICGFNKDMAISVLCLSLNIHISSSQNGGTFLFWLMYFI